MTNNKANPLFGLEYVSNEELVKILRLELKLLKNDYLELLDQNDKLVKQLKTYNEN